MNSNIDEKEAELRHNNRIARALLNKLYFNINDLKTWQELFDLVKKILRLTMIFGGNFVNWILLKLNIFQ